HPRRCRARGGDLRRRQVGGARRGRVVAGGGDRGCGAADAVRQGGAAGGGGPLPYMNPPPSISRTTAIANTIRQKLRPPFERDRAPRPMPTTAIGRTNQLPQPRNGMVEGIASTRATIPTRIEAILSMCLVWVRHSWIARLHGPSPLLGLVKPTSWEWPPA